MEPGRLKTIEATARGCLETLTRDNAHALMLFIEYGVGESFTIFTRVGEGLYGMIRPQRAVFQQFYQDDSQTLLALGYHWREDGEVRYRDATYEDRLILALDGKVRFSLYHDPENSLRLYICREDTHKIFVPSLEITF